MGEAGNEHEERIEMENQPLNSEKLAAATGTANANGKEKLLALGLTKDELMKYANDPFWRKLRKTLFALFWILWIAMFVGAFLIIKYVPNCPASSRLRWYQKSAFLQLDMNLFDRKLTNVNDKLQQLGDSFGFKSYILNDPFKHSSSKVSDYHSINYEYGTEENLGSLLTKLKERKENLIFDLELESTSKDNPWFIKEVTNFSNAYLTLPQGKKLPQGYRTEPVGEHKIIFTGDSPVLNLTNPAVRQLIRDVLKHWTKQGVRGFRVINVPYLINLDGENENLKANQKFLSDLITDLRLASSDAVLLLHANRDASKYRKFNNQPVADIVTSNIFSHVTSADAIVDEYLNVLNETAKLDSLDSKQPPAQWNGYMVDSNNDHAACISNTLAFLTGYGSPISKFDITLFSTHDNPERFWDNVNDHADSVDPKGDTMRIFKRLNSIRAQFADQVTLGLSRIPNKSVRNVFAVARYTDAAGILIISNDSDSENSFSLNIQDNKYISKEGKVIFACNSKKSPKLEQSLDLHSSDIKIDGKHVIVVKFDVIKE